MRGTAARFSGKQKKITIELGRHSPKDVVVSYKMLRVITSMSGKLIPECEMAGLRKELRHGQVVQQMMLFLEC